MADQKRDKYRWTYWKKWPKFDMDHFGLAPHDVYRRLKVWSGPGRGYGTEAVTDTLITPRPRVEVVSDRIKETSGGQLVDGDVVITMPAAFDWKGHTGGYSPAYFQPLTNPLMELYLYINGEEWKILEGPGPVERFLIMRLFARRYMAS